NQRLTNRVGVHRIGIRKKVFRLCAQTAFPVTKKALVHDLLWNRAKVVRITDVAPSSSGCARALALGATFARTRAPCYYRWRHRATDENRHGTDIGQFARATAPTGSSGCLDQVRRSLHAIRVLL